MRRLLNPLLKAGRLLPSIPPLLVSRKPKVPSTSCKTLYQWRFPTPSRRFSLPALRHISSTASSQLANPTQDDHLQVSGDAEQEVSDMEWEDEEEDTERRIDDGGDGGGVVLQNMPWGDRVLSIAHEVLSQFSDDIKLFAFKVSSRGYIYVRLDKLSNDYGCPSVEEIESYSRQYKIRLEEEGSKGEIPDDLALEVSSPGAERLVRIPDDLERFHDFPMVVSYVDAEGAKSKEKTGVFLVHTVEAATGHIVWKLADVKENRDPSSKGRPLSRKQKDWRLKLPYADHRMVTLHLGF